MSQQRTLRDFEHSEPRSHIVSVLLLHFGVPGDFTKDFSNSTCELQRYGHRTRVIRRIPVQPSQGNEFLSKFISCRVTEVLSDFQWSRNSWAFVLPQIRHISISVD